MLNDNNDLGAALFKTWTEKQRSDEIEKLVQGFRNGVPIGILCKMAETVAGDQEEGEEVPQNIYERRTSGKRQSPLPPMRCCRSSNRFWLKFDGVSHAEDLYCRLRLHRGTDSAFVSGIRG